VTDEHLGNVTDQAGQTSSNPLDCASVPGKARSKWLASTAHPYVERDTQQQEQNPIQHRLRAIAVIPNTMENGSELWQVSGLKEASKLFTSRPHKNFEDATGQN
jgi:hypothetical protein